MERLGGLFDTTYKEFKLDDNPETKNMINDMDLIYSCMCNDPVNIKFLLGLNRPIQYYASEIVNNFWNYSNYNYSWVTCMETVDWYNNIYATQLDRKIFMLNLVIPSSTFIHDDITDLYLLLFKNHIDVNQKIDYIRKIIYNNQKMRLNKPPSLHFCFRNILRCLAEKDDYDDVTWCGLEYSRYEPKFINFYNNALVNFTNINERIKYRSIPVNLLEKINDTLEIKEIIRNEVIENKLDGTKYVYKLNIIKMPFTIFLCMKSDFHKYILKLWEDREISKKDISEINRIVEKELKDMICPIPEKLFRNFWKTEFLDKFK